MSVRQKSRRISRSRSGSGEKLSSGLGSWREGLEHLISLLEETSSSMVSVDADKLLEILGLVGRLEREVGTGSQQALGSGGPAKGGLESDGLLLIREYVKEAVYRFSVGDDAGSVLAEALSVARALRDLGALAERGIEIIRPEDLVVVGYIDGKPVYSLRQGNSPNR
jgi:phage-related baseplate assembly protein